MNTPGSILSENNQINNLSNHDNFFLKNKGEIIEIYPELVEIAEHITLGLDKHPEFKNKIMNCKYDILIGDDVSGRPVTLLIKHIINYFKKQNGLLGGIDNIFIDNPNAIKYGGNIPSIFKEIASKKVIITTEYISQGRAINSIISNLGIQNDDVDVFTQRLEKAYTEKDLYNKYYSSTIKNQLYYKIQNIQNDIYNIFYGDSHHLPPKIFDNTHFDGKREHLVGLTSQEDQKIFSTKLPPRLYNQTIINNTRKQIKLLGEYIITNHLS